MTVLVPATAAVDLVEQILAGALVDHLTKRFGRLTAVSDVNLRVSAGEIVGFLGPNGAGKTTTIRTLMGFLRPSLGACSVLGGELGSDTRLRRRVGYLPGDFRADLGMTGADLFRWFAELRGGLNRRRVDELVERLQLDPTRKFATLSKGNRQKVGVVQAFMHDPIVLILDEPTSGLDPLMQHEFLGLVRDAAQRGAAVLISSHMLPEVERIASRVAIIRAGQLVMASTIDELWTTRDDGSSCTSLLAIGGQARAECGRARATLRVVRTICGRPG